MNVHPPDTNGNTNHLHNIECPACGQYEELLIRGTVEIWFTDADRDSSSGDVNWDRKWAETTCPKCGYVGPLHNFKMDVSQ